MKLIDRARNYLEAFLNLYSEDADALMLHSGLHKAHAFIIGTDVFHVGEQAYGKLPWSMPFDETWFEWKLADDPEPEDPAMIAAFYRNNPGVHIRDMGAAHYGMLSMRLPESVAARLISAPDVAFDSIHYAFTFWQFFWHRDLTQQMLRNKWPTTLAAHGVMIYPDIGLVVKDESPEQTTCRVAQLWYPNAGPVFWHSELNSTRGCEYGSNRAVSAMAALSCRNVVGVQYTPTAAECKAQRRAGNLEPVAYRTLRVEVPRAAGGGHGDPDLVNPADPKRLHVVRGHFKNLKDPKFKNPGWHWWPAHLRGSLEKGVVVKDYKLDASQEE